MREDRETENKETETEMERQRRTRNKPGGAPNPPQSSKSVSSGGLGGDPEPGTLREKKIGRVFPMVWASRLGDRRRPKAGKEEQRKKLEQQKTDRSLEMSSSQVQAGNETDLRT